MISLQIVCVGAVLALALYWFARRYLDYDVKREIRIFKKSFLCNRLRRRFLLYEIAVANVTLMRMILSPSFHPTPVLVTFTVPLRSDYTRTMLANSITLTPGTITVALEGDTYTVHCLDESLSAGMEDGVFVRMLRKNGGMTWKLLQKAYDILFWGALIVFAPLPDGLPDPRDFGSQDLGQDRVDQYDWYDNNHYARDFLRPSRPELSGGRLHHLCNAELYLRHCADEDLHGRSCGARAEKSPRRGRTIRLRGRCAVIWEWIRFAVAAAFIVSGLVFELISVIGVYRFKYVLNRMHAAAMGDTLGISLCADRTDGNSRHQL